jgi:hypothetical protein
VLGTVVDAAGDAIATDGAVVSAEGATDTVTDVDVEFDDVSYAVTVRLWLPAASEGDDQDQELVPVAVVAAPPSTETVTLARDLLSAADPVAENGLLTLAPLVGVATLTVGAVVSVVVVHLRLQVVVADPPPWAACAATGAAIRKATVRAPTRARLT